MSKLIYITNASLDGYIEDKTGAFDWGNPDQVFDFITELMRPIGTHLLGRRLYETMAYWDAPVEGYPPEHRDFARVWQKAEQIVFSRTLTGAPTRNARVERDFDPRGNSETQARIGARHLHRRRRAGGTCARIRSRRRMSPVSPSGDRRRRKAGIPNRAYDGISNSLRRDVSAPEQSTCAIACGALLRRRDCPADFHHALLDHVLTRDQNAIDFNSLMLVDDVLLHTGTTEVR